MTNNINIEPKVPISKPLPKRDISKAEENKDAIKKTTGIIAAERISLSLGTVNLPSPSLAINQKNTASVVPIESKKGEIKNEKLNIYYYDFILWLCFICK